MIIKTNGIKETERTAKSFVEKNTQAEQMREKALIVGLYGDLGSGKTTFVKGIAKVFGLEKTITSPTFVIEKIYKLKNQVCDNLIHIDAYRLKSGDELLNLGWKEISKNPKNIIFIEWPENVNDILPSDAKNIKFRFVDKNIREIIFLN